MWKDVHLCGETLGEIHHASETHLSLSKVTCVLDPILSHPLRNITPAAFLPRYVIKVPLSTGHIHVQTCQDLFP